MEWNKMERGGSSTTLDLPVLWYYFDTTSTWYYSGPTSTLVLF